MIKVVITGANGLVGSRIISLLNNTFQIFPLLHSDCDITQADSVAKYLSNLNPDILLHLASYTAVDRAEIEKETAFAVNVLGTKNLFNVAKSKNIKFIYISTDFVFDGTKPPYFENSIPNPISTYAKTKYEAEKIIGKEGMIVRISYPYRTEFLKKKDFFRVILDLLKNKKTVEMVKDSIMTPTFIDDIAEALGFLINNFSNEIFHIVGSSSHSPYEIGLIIADIFRFNSKQIVPISYSSYFKNKAKRPQFMEIKSNKNNFYKMKTFKEGLLEISKRIKLN
jgi:dTDP-4-dehydrorhamnose reductase